MITRYDILMEARATVGIGDHPDDKRRLERLLNKIIMSLSERHSWLLLRRKMTIDLADSSSTSGEEGVWLPANLAGVDGVQDSSTGDYYYRRETSDIGNVEFPMNRYSVYAPGLAPLFWTDDLNITKGDSTLVSQTLAQETSDDYVGEWARLGNEPGYYKIGADWSIDPTYWGEQISAGALEIRPKSQKKLVVWTDHDTIKTSGEVVLYYWTYHAPMYRDSDELMFPYPRLIELMMQKEAKGSLSRRARDPLNMEIDDAWKETVRLNPSFVIPANALDRVGRNFDPAKMQWSSRDKKSFTQLDTSTWRPLT